MNIYLAGPMRGIAKFNFPKFFKVATELRAEGHNVFNPAERDVKLHGKKIYENNKRGSVLQAEKHGFSLRRALAADTSWICRYADGVVVLPGWQKSKGAKAEIALAKALGLKLVFHKDKK